MKNKKSNKYRLSEVSQASIETAEVPYADYSNTDILNTNDRMPRGIEVDENRIYFYCSVGTSEALELNRLLRKLDIEIEDRSGNTPLNTCGIHGNLPLAKFLLENGANVFQKNKMKRNVAEVEGIINM